VATSAQNHSTSGFFAAKTVLITGASSGLGLALARIFAAENANLVLVSRSEEKLNAAAASLAVPAERVLVAAADVTRRAQVDAAVASGIERFGGIDLLISNAGLNVLGPFADLPAEEAKRVFDINFLGAFHIVQAALHSLRKRPGSQIVLVSSILGLRAAPRSSVYCAAKFAVNGLAESLRMELKHEGVHVLVVCPGRLDTPFFDNARSLDGKQGLQLQRAMNADLAAAKILSAIRSRKRLLIIPWWVRTLHWLNLWSPRLTDRLVENRFEKEGLL
jgi:short-subunit dehydrogenase